MIARKFIISDTHINHEKIIETDNRPFTDVKQMEKEIINRWNNVVTKHDDVYIVGDMFLGSAREAARVLRQLNGNKHLIRGNHDKWLNSETKRLFNEIVDYKELRIDGNLVILCHYPIILHRAHRRDNAIHLFGHVHTTEEEMEVLRQIKSAIKHCNSAGKAYNVCASVDYMDYTPRELDYIVQEGDKRWRYLEAKLASQH